MRGTEVPYQMNCGHSVNVLPCGNAVFFLSLAFIIISIDS